MTDHLDLLLIEREITITFELLFDAIPPVDASDILDGNMLELFVGKAFHEIPDILEGDADPLSFFSLVELPEAKYYLGGYLLWVVRKVRYARDYYPLYQIPEFLMVVPYITLMGFLVSEEAVTWIKSCKTLPSLIVRILDLVVNTAGFMLDDEDRQQILQARALYLPAA